MMFFDLNHICEFATKEGFKLINIGEIDDLEYENTIYLKPDKYVLENFFYLARQEGKHAIFYNEVAFDANKFHINESEVIDYLKRKHSLTFEKGVYFYDNLLKIFELRNASLYLHKGSEKEIVSFTLTFVTENTQYVMTFEDRWYTKLVLYHERLNNSLEYTVDRYVKKHKRLLKKEV
ncbi:hypothetical protein [Bacillus thuringiensis]|uniref:hypothetical protein n=1 Tax=Bacillus thuringiensis TaxID=1428 RepID=UPI0011A33333|nr:hypothetical protein [Bacillus thuringiensis]